VGRSALFENSVSLFCFSCKNFIEQGPTFMILKLLSPKTWRKMAFLPKQLPGFAKTCSLHSFLRKNADFSRRKLAKIAENCDHNIDPWTQSYFFSNFKCLRSQNRVSKEEVFF
jgi:hypothetical protein